MRWRKDPRCPRPGAGAGPALSSRTREAGCAVSPDRMKRSIPSCLTNVTSGPAARRAEQSLFRFFFFPHLILCSQNEMDGVLFPGDHSCAEVPHPSPSSARLPWCIGRGRQGHLAGAQPFQAMLTTWPTLQCSRP